MALFRLPALRSPCSFVCVLLLLAGALVPLRRSGRISQALLVCGDDVIVEALVELSDDVAP